MNLHLIKVKEKRLVCFQHIKLASQISQNTYDWLRLKQNEGNTKLDSFDNQQDFMNETAISSEESSIEEGNAAHELDESYMMEKSSSRGKI